MRCHTLCSSMIVFLASAACGSKDAPPDPSMDTATAAPAGPTSPVEANPPASTAEPRPAEPAPDPFALGSCEVVVDGGAPRKTPGGASNVSTRYWAGPMTNNPSWALLINCGPWSVSGNGDAEKFPMKPGRYGVVKSGLDPEPNATVIGPSPVEGGELTIESWDMHQIKGSFELRAKKSFEDPTVQSVKGTFDFKCPYTKPGEPCLEKPNRGP